MNKYDKAFNAADEVFTAISNGKNVRSRIAEVVSTMVSHMGGKVTTDCFIDNDMPLNPCITAINSDGNTFSVDTDDKFAGETINVGCDLLNDYETISVFYYVYDVYSSWYTYANELAEQFKIYS